MTASAGLSDIEAAFRLKTEGPNELSRGDHRTLARIVVDVMKEPMFGLLLGGGAVYLVLGNTGEALVLLAFACISVVITIVQQTRSEHVLEALRDLTSPRALVIRDGQRKRIAGREVVRGDLVLLAEGDRVPADARLLSCDDLQTDESLLTGESVPVRKIAQASSGESARPGGDDLPYVFSGTMVVRGQGEAEVLKTGPRSEIGKIGQSLQTVQTEPPLLFAQTEQLVSVLAKAAFAISAAAVLLYGFMRGSWIKGLLGGIALSMAMLPEEFPLVLSVFMVMGAWRISQTRVLTRQASAIETLGAATVLCSDKTGTMTQNEMSVAEIRTGGQCLRPASDPTPWSPAVMALVRIAGLASASDPFDPMEKAIRRLGARLPGATGTQGGPELLRSYGIRPDLLLMAQVWRDSSAGDEQLVAAKGAPETVAALCRLGAHAREEMGRNAGQMASQGMRVLGIAKAGWHGAVLPDSQREFTFEFQGLIGLADPLREAVPAAVRECQSAGIRVVMITGDYPATARAIATQAGLSPGEILTGEEVADMDDETLEARAETATVFARTMPEQKLRIVNALKASGEIVAMTGDGVNDAPSLKSAHIGIAMGGRGTDVAREASAIVLLDDDFASIVRTIRLGRRVYDNLRKAMNYIVAVHVPIAGVSLFPLVFGSPLALLPVHIAFLEAVIDPVCSLAFEAEPEETDVMNRGPRDPQSPLFGGSQAGWSLFQGALVLALVASVYTVALKRGMPDNELRAITFLALILTNIGLIFVNRSFSSSLWIALRRPNSTLSWLIGAAASLTAIVLLWPPASSLFQFGPIHLHDALACGAVGLVALVVLELLKPVWRSRMTD